MENQYFGIIQDITVDNFDTTKEIESPLLMSEKDVQVIHYPDCQQLIVWLPGHDSNYTFLILKNETEEIVQKNQIGDVLQGSRKMIMDTLPLAPGNYVLQIEKQGGIKHEIRFRKYDDLYKAPLNQTQAPDVEDRLKGKGYFRDGTGKPLSDQDLLSREIFFREMTMKVSRKLEYSGNVRAGSVEYTDGEIKLTFISEMGSGQCMFYIHIPTEMVWEDITKTPLEERTEILDFIAQTAKRDHISNGRFEIFEDHIGFYSE